LNSIILSDWLVQRLTNVAGEPAYRQINRLIQQAILTGQLAPGAKLPSSRILADELKVARNTVLHVYEQLTAEGYVVSSTGSGTYVADTRPVKLTGARSTPSANVAQAQRKHLSTRGQQLIDHAGVSKLQWGAFMPGVPDVSEFPSKVWNRLQAKLWRQPNHELLTYATGSGYRPLRRALSDYLRVARSVNCSPDQIIITTGVHQSVDLAVKLLSDIGDSAWLEEPCYWGVRSVFQASGLELKPIPIDAEGLNPSAADMQHAPRLILVTPSHQYPLGMVMSLARRRALLEFASKHRSWIIEDDYDSEFRYGSRPISSLQGLDTAGQVIYVGSFSKTLFPGLRIGYMVVPEALIETFRIGIAELYREGQLMQQALLTEFIIDGYLTSHIRRMRALYGERRALLIEAIHARFGDSLPVMGDEAGLHLILSLPEGVSDQKISEQAREQGILTRPLTRYYNHPEPAQAGLLLGYACVPNARIAPAFETLAQVVEEHL